MHQRLAPAGAAAGPRFAEPMADNFQVADFETDEIALRHTPALLFRAAQLDPNDVRAFNDADGVDKPDPTN